MNELERVLAAVPRPEPSDQLDQRVNALLAPGSHSSPRVEMRWKSIGVLAGATLCAGVLGFYCGRLSVGTAPEKLAVTVGAPNQGRRSAATPEAGKVLSVPLEPHQLSGLFVPSAAEAVFGNGPVYVEVTTSP